MKNILNKLTISSYTYFFILICFLCGYLKNILIIFFICLFHELGHIFFIKLFHYDIIKVELLPFGGFTTVNQKINSNINKDLLIACGGFIFQFILFLLLHLFSSFFKIRTYHLFNSYNLILFLFNLIPIIPLDGSQISHLILEKFFSYHLAYYLNFVLSLLSLGIFGLFNYLGHFDNYFIITFLLYKVIKYLQNYRYLEKRFFLERYLDKFEYSKIDNHTKKIQDLKKGVYHFFKEDNHYVSEKDKIFKEWLKAKQWKN